MKLFANYSNPVPFKDDEIFVVEVIHIAGTYAMVKRKNCVPFVAESKRLSYFNLGKDSRKAE